MDDLILITGSNGGIGSGVTQYLLENGFKNVICQYNRNSDKIESILKEYDLPTEKHLFKADLLKEDNIKEMRENISKNFTQKVAILLNFAGGSNNSMSWKLSTEQFQNIINMNLLTTFQTCREFIPSMRENNFGRIINVSSVVGFTGVAGASHYCAAKAGITGFSKAISHELINKNITVNTLALGYFNTGIISEVPEEIQEKIKQTIPSKRFGTTLEIGSLVKYLISPEAAYTTGQVHHINGGLY